MKFVFGSDAHQKLVGLAEALPEVIWPILKRPAKCEIKTEKRIPRERHKEDAIARHEYRHLEHEHIAVIAERPGACEIDYGVVIVRKTITVTKGKRFVVPEIRYFF